MGIGANPETVKAPTITAYDGEPMIFQENRCLVGDRNAIFGAKLAVYGVLTEGIGEYTKNGGSAVVGDYNELHDVLFKLAQCESGFKDKCIIDTNGLLSCGWFQFQKRTFYHYCEGDWKDPDDQTKCAIYLIQKGRGPYEWVNCWKKLNLLNKKI